MCGNLLNTLDPGNTHGRPSVLNGWTIHYWVFWNTHAHTHTHTYTHTRVVFLQPTRITKGNRNYLLQYIFLVLNQRSLLLYYLLQYFIFLGFKSTLPSSGPVNYYKPQNPAIYHPRTVAPLLHPQVGQRRRSFIRKPKVHILDGVFCSNPWVGSASAVFSFGGEGREGERA
jgi:hypothetical protein